MAERTGIMLAYPFEAGRFRRMSKVKYVQPKLEGCRGRCLLEAGKDPVILSSSGERITSVPHINEALKFITPSEGCLELDGELYKHGWDQGRITGICNTKIGLPNNYQEVNYYIFDLIHDRVRQMSRFAFLDTLELSEPLNHVETHEVTNFDQVSFLYEMYKDDGYEGVVIRDSLNVYERKKTVKMLKLKPRNSGVYKVIDYTQEISIHGEPKESLGALVLKTPEGNVFNVGTGFKRWQREEFWKNRDVLKGHECKIRFQGLTEDRKVPYALSFEKLIDPLRFY